jgi:hypothetical protein
MAAWEIYFGNRLLLFLVFNLPSAAFASLFFHIPAPSGQFAFNAPEESWKRIFCLGCVHKNETVNESQFQTREREIERAWKQISPERAWPDAAWCCCLPHATTIIIFSRLEIVHILFPKRPPPSSLFSSAAAARFGEKQDDDAFVRHHQEDEGGGGCGIAPTGERERPGSIGHGRKKKK